MGKLTYLRPRRGDIRPILLLLTSHRLDCFLICIRCLERYTDLDRFKHIYVIANAVSPEHLAMVRRFASRHANVSVLERGPRGLVPAVLEAQNEILAAHGDDVVVRIDEDVFVTTHWFEHLIDGYLEHAERVDVPVVMPLVPISPPGRHMLNRFLRVSYPSESHMYVGPPTPENWVYHRWMWEKLLYENLSDIYLRDAPPKYGYVGELSSNCLIFDQRLMRRMLPFPTTKIDGVAVNDELVMNVVLREEHLKVAVLGRSLVHHYSYAGCEDYLRGHVPLEKVWRYVQGGMDIPPMRRRACPSGPSELSLLRAGA